MDLLVGKRTSVCEQTISYKQHYRNNKFRQTTEKFLVTEKWEQAQVAFSKLCRSKKSTTPHSGCYFYNLNLVKTNYKGETLKGNYRVWQFFFQVSVLLLI